MTLQHEHDDLRLVAETAATEALRRLCANPDAIVPEYLTTKQLAQYLGVTATTLEMWRGAGKGPSHTRIGRWVRYRRADVDGWMAANRIMTREAL